MVITYEIDNNLYVNITNKCSNACDFCIRHAKDAFNVDLWLQREPTLDEILKDIFKRDLSKYNELVFCGFGEPLERVDEIIEACKQVKAKSNIRIRINTNGQGNLIHNEDITPRFQSLVDCVSISLNARNAEEYEAICHSDYGLSAFPAILDFTKKARLYVKHVQLSVVDCLPPEHIEECRKIAEGLGVKLRIRHEFRA